MLKWNADDNTFTVCGWYGNQEIRLLDDAAVEATAAHDAEAVAA